MSTRIPSERNAMTREEKARQDWIKAIRFYGSGTEQENKFYREYVNLKQGIKPNKKQTAFAGKEFKR